MLVVCLAATAMITSQASALEEPHGPHRQLQASTTTDRRSIGGQYTQLGVKPIAVAHAKQLPGTNQFLMMVSSSCPPHPQSPQQGFMYVIGYVRLTAAVANTGVAGRMASNAHQQCSSPLSPPASPCLNLGSQ
jgi:hypothetical protein